jgi:hypothetical protein
MGDTMVRKLLRVEIAGVLIAAILLLNSLMIRPVIGVADNGDFARIMHTTGLQHMSSDYHERYFGYLNREYVVTPPKLDAPSEESYFSTEVLYVNVAKLLCRLITGNDRIFDIRYLAFVYSCIFLASLFVLMRYGRQISPAGGVLLAALLLLVFMDAGYVAYFNSLYGEAVSLTSLLLTVASALLLVRQEKPRLMTLVCFFGAAILLAGAKAQNAPLGIILAAFSLRLYHLRKDSDWKKLTAVLCILLVLLSAKSYLSIPEGIRTCNKYQSVFFGVVKDSQTPERDLKELGIDPKFAILAGTNYFMKEYPMDIGNPGLQQQLRERVSPFKTALFYLRHPARYLQKLELSAFYGFKLVEGFGNYEKAEGRGYGAVTQSFRAWSNFKVNIVPHSLLLIVVFFCAYLLVLVRYYIKYSSSRKYKLSLEILFLVWLTGSIQFIIPIIADGEADLSKHLFLFNACLDFLFVTAMFWLTALASKSAERLKKRLFNRKTTEEPACSEQLAIDNIQ